MVADDPRPAPVETFPKRMSHNNPRVLSIAAAALGLGWLAAFPPGARADQDVLTQHNDQWRTGANTHETLLTPANVNNAQFGKLYSYAVDGYVYAQPLYVNGVTIAGAKHKVLYVATMEDSVYAFDADKNAAFWHRQFTGGNITPVPIADITGSNTLNIHGNVGILSTPVIDKATSTLYVLARTKDTAANAYLQSLHALDLATGNEKFGGPVTISPPASTPSCRTNARRWPCPRGKSTSAGGRTRTTRPTTAG